MVSVAGAFLPGTYERDSHSMAAQGMGQDLVDLFLGVPLLMITFIYASRGSRVARLLYAGILFYILYSFVIYCFGVHFNRLFLLYCFTLALSLYAFIIVMIGFGKEDVAGWFNYSPARAVSIYIFFVALVFYGMWLKSIVPALISNSVPADLTENDLLVNPVHVIDLAFALPGLILGSILLWRGQGMGYVIASVALVFMVFLTVALAAMVVMLVLKDVNEDFTVAVVFGALSISSLAFAVALLRKVRSSP
jgi:hypothetical protein